MAAPGHVLSGGWGVGYYISGGQCLMCDRDDLQRRADVLQRVADQLSAQLRVERWSNAELRRLLGEPSPPAALDQERAAAWRFLTFASVAVMTAAAVALLVARPWHAAPSRVEQRLARAVPTVQAHIVPFTIVDSIEAARARATPAAPLTSYEYDAEVIFARPASPVRLQAAPPWPGPRTALDLQLPTGWSEVTHVP